MLAPWIADPAAKLLLSQWSHEIELDLLRLGTTADADEIKDTANAQPLIVAAGLLGARALGKARIAIVAGHSVGEITAAAISGVIDDVDAMKLVRARGVEMAKAAALKPAGMAAVLGGDREVVLRAISGLGLVTANDNGGGQIVAAGDLDALAKLHQKVREFVCSQLREHFIPLICNLPSRLCERSLQRFQFTQPFAL